MTATPMVGATFFGLDISQLSTWLLSLRRKISKRVLLLEFGPDFLLLAEATLTQHGVQLNHISSFSLPPEALDRGVPAEPLKMAGLIQDFCSEKKIPAHRVAVVLSPELAFQRLLDLPSSLTTDEAREYVLNPANGLQIPFPLTQTDFDLFPVSTPTEVQHVGGKRLYMLTAIPEVLVDRIVEMLQAVDLELQLLEIGSHSQLRNHAADLITLAPRQVDLVLELLPDCSNLMLVSCSGLLGSERLSAVRNLPDLELAEEQQVVAISSGLTAENLVFKDENYLPLSALDLRVLVADLRDAFDRFHLKLPGAQIRRLMLTGVNSSHPLLVDLLGELLGLPVVLSQSIPITGLDDLSMDELLLRSSLGRLTGLALGLLPNDQLLSCSLEVHNLVNQDTDDSHHGVALADLWSASEAQTGLDLGAAEVSSAVSVTEDENDNDELLGFDPGSEASITFDSPVASGTDFSTEVVDKPAPLIDTSVSSIDAEELPSSLITAPSRGESSLDAPLGLTPSDTSSDLEDDGSPTSLSESNSVLADEIVDDEDIPKEQWPSINTVSSVDADQDSSPNEIDFLEESLVNGSSRSNSISAGMDVSRPETEWPSIPSLDEVHSGLDQDLGDVPSAWPSISFDHDQEVIETTVVSEDLDTSTSSADVHLEKLEYDQTQSSSLPSEQLQQSEQSSSESLGVATPLEESMLEKEEESVIPDLGLTGESVQSQQLSTDQVSASNNVGTDQVLQDLGELRFAQDD